MEHNKSPDRKCQSLWEVMNKENVFKENMSIFEEKNLSFSQLEYGVFFIVTSDPFLDHKIPGCVGSRLLNFDAVEVEYFARQNDGRPLPMDIHWMPIG